MLKLRYPGKDISFEKEKQVSNHDWAIVCGNALDKNDIDINHLKEIDPDELEICVWDNITQIKGMDDQIVDSQDWSSFGVL